MQLVKLSNLILSFFSFTCKCKYKLACTLLQRNLWHFNYIFIHSHPTFFVYQCRRLAWSSHYTEIITVLLAASGVHNICYLTLIYNPSHLQRRCPMCPAICNKAGSGECLINILNLISLFVLLFLHLFPRLPITF